jgi:hypothetical protein
VNVFLGVAVLQYGSVVVLRRKSVIA